MVAGAAALESGRRGRAASLCLTWNCVTGPFVSGLSSATCPFRLSYLPVHALYPISWGTSNPSLSSERGRPCVPAWWNFGREKGSPWKEKKKKELSLSIEYIHSKDRRNSREIGKHELWSFERIRSLKWKIFIRRIDLNKVEMYRCRTRWTSPNLLRNDILEMYLKIIKIDKERTLIYFFFQWSTKIL